MHAARWRVIALWLSWAAGVTVESGLLNELIGGLERHRHPWRAVTLGMAFFLAPFLVLAPLNAFFSSRFGARWVLLAAAGLMLPVISLVFLADAHVAEGLLLLAVHVVGVVAAATFTAVWAVLPGAADEARWPMSRVGGAFVLATLIGLVAGSHWADPAHKVAHKVAQEVAQEVAQAPVHPALLFALLCAGSALAAWPLHFASERRTEDSLRVGVRRFDTDARRIGRSPESFGFLQALMLFCGLVAALFTTLLLESAGSPLVLPCGLVAGLVAAGLPAHRTRALGWIPYGPTGLLIVLVVAAWATEAGAAILASSGFLTGLVCVPLLAGYLAGLPWGTRSTGVSLAGAAGLAAALGGFFPAWMLAGAHTEHGPTLALRLWILAGMVLIVTVVAWRKRLRDALELLASLVFLPVYRIRALGPGVGRFPVEGPVLVVANHAAWFDPLWLGKVIPRRLTPLMVSSFYDLPVINWLMRRVVRAVRVQESRYRHHVPELAEAVERLDRGECVVVFPEALLRRREEALLRRFGQGVWHILTRRPETAVVACWIEGGWGSFTSYYNGPPGRNKRFDFRRPITIVIDEPQEVPTEVLAKHQLTRAYLANRVLALRRHLHADPLPTPVADRSIATD